MRIERWHLIMTAALLGGPLPGWPAAVEVERGPHHKRWRTIRERVSPTGMTFRSTNDYVQLASGLHFWDGEQWRGSRNEVEILNGLAVGWQAPHRAVFEGNINTVGAITVEAPDGHRFKSHVLALVYHVAGGQIVTLAEITDSQGGLLEPNQVYYPDALVGAAHCTLRYTFTKAGVEQDVIITQAPPPPEAYGLTSASTRLAVLTEFVEAPPAVVKRIVLRGQTDPALPDLVDEELQFGTMGIGAGHAFGLGAEADGLGEGAIPTVKSWQQIGDRVILVEEVEHPAIAPYLRQLPQAALEQRGPRPGVGPANAGEKLWAAHLPPRPSGRHLPWREQRWAQLPRRGPGVVIDYTLLNTSLTNYTFEAGSTSLIDGTVNLYGTTVMEGTAVLKFATNTTAPTACAPSPTRMVTPSPSITTPPIA